MVPMLEGERPKAVSMCPLPTLVEKKWKMPLLVGPEPLQLVLAQPKNDKSRSPTSPRSLSAAVERSIIIDSVGSVASAFPSSFWQIERT